MLFTAHALLVEGDSSILAQLRVQLLEANEATQGEPDYFERVYNTFGVDDARDIAARTSTKASLRSRRVFVIVTPVLTVEAQNALLKSIEEPLSPSLLILITARPQSLLSTLRSRMQTYRLASTSDDQAARAFIKASLEQRLEQIKQMLGKDSDERDMSVIYDFLTSLERTLASGDRKISAKGLGAVYRAKRYIADKGSLVKSLLEQVAHLTPSKID